MTRRRSLLTLQWAACAAARDEASLYRRGTRGRRVGRLVGVLRAPLSLERMTYLPDAGMVMYRFHMHKGLKRNFQLMPGAQWLELLCHHIPDRFEHLVQYVGWYSTRCR
ncbi:MAG: hypothetical protein E6H80_09815, partial [Betaproteobacteria bacterium]